MRVLICGSRDWKDASPIAYIMDNYLDPDTDTVIVGGARGADSIAQSEALARCIPVIVVPAQWDRHGRAAGPIRNQQMIDRYMPDVVYAFPMSYSKGTSDMLCRAEKAGIPVIVTNG